MSKQVGKFGEENKVNERKRKKTMGVLEEMEELISVAPPWRSSTSQVVAYPLINSLFTSAGLCVSVSTVKKELKQQYQSYQYQHRST